MKILTKRKWIFIIFFLIVITIIRVSWMNFIEKLDYPSAPTANQGELDLRSWDFSSKQTFMLNGEWEFYPNSLATSNSLPEHNKKYLRIPSINSWDESFEGQDDFRYGTYRLKILINDTDIPTLGLRLNSVKDATSIYVNGQLIGGSGTLAIKENQHEADTIPYSVSFDTDQSEIELLIHVSSNLKEAGILKPIRLGTIDAINHRVYISNNLQLLLCVVLTLHLIYGIILFFIGSTQRKGMVYFSLLLFSAVISVLVSDDRLLFTWLSIDYELQVKITFLSYIGVAAFIPPFIHNLFPNPRNKRMIRYFSLYCMLDIGFVLISSSKDIINLIQIVLGSVLILSVMISINILRKFINEIEGIIFLIIGCLSIAVNLIWTSNLSDASIDMMHYPFDLIFAILSFTAFWFKRFFIATSDAKKLAVQLQLEDQRKDDFLIKTSHELRNPLHGIMNMVQTILDDKEKPPSNEHKKHLSIAIDISKRLSLLLNDLLDVTRLKQKTIQLNMNRVHLQVVTAGVIDMLKFLGDKKPVKFKIEISNTFPPVLADENRLIQILFNLLHNALKFTDEGTIIIRASRINGMAHIEIEDTGVGMNPEEIERIFKPFEQASENNRTDSSGIGIGLSICKELVELHNGDLSLKSTSEKGSIFTFTLPILNESVEAEGTSPSKIENQMIGKVAATIEHVHPDQFCALKDIHLNKRMKILAVDDDPINLYVLQNVLKNDGYEITTVSNGFQAVAKLEIESYDLVISDVMMPQMSGYELTKIIRNRFSLIELPVLLLTARTRSEDILTGLQSGANDYITKPVDSWELKARVRVLSELKLTFEERLRMEGAWLQSQIQPHFIFNTLNSIAALSMMDTPRMQLLLEEFSNYLRLSFDFKNTEPTVPLDYELSLVRSYIYIENERFSNRLTVVWEIDDPIDIHVPPLSIQTLVENAVKHGILKKTSGGTIRIQIRKQNTFTTISIIDNGQGIPEDKLQDIFNQNDDYSKEQGIGLLNTDRRLRQLYGKGLVLKSKTGQGTVVSFSIPNNE
ncbi:response regulator [Cytobacillus kochii]|uniref:hybrid sensor histidine kinase/response regulator n=1 Tax=Cytobacillus kochii TaxID=859143 RepID=UPI001CD577D2|nr:ATP-binding protein [Cytobacillus kochii]MCA1024519.1 response regulator [Cytobacillus kochii]